MKRILEGEAPEDGGYAGVAEVEYFCTDERRSLGFIVRVGDGRLTGVGWRDSDLRHIRMYCK